MWQRGITEPWISPPKTTLTVHTCKPLCCCSSKSQILCTKNCDDGIVGALQVSDIVLLL